MKRYSEIYPEAIDRLAKPSPAVIMSDRYKTFQEFTGGFRPREYTVLCGSTGSGKTTLAANWCADFLMRENPVPHYVASVETGPIDFMCRVMSAMAGEDFNSGKTIPVEDLNDFHSKFGDYFFASKDWLALHEDRTSLDLLKSEIIHAVENDGAKVAIIDNMNFFLEPTRAADALIELDRVTHELVVFCKQTDIHIIMIMHPRKTDNGRVNDMFDVKGSSTAVQEAHNIFLFNRANPLAVKEGIMQPSDRELKIAKMRRQGKYVGQTICFRGINGVKYEEDSIIQNQ